MGTFTLSTGLGMLGVGFLAIAIIGGIASVSYTHLRAHET